MDDAKEENEMANCCCTDYYFYGPKKEVTKFWQIFENMHQRMRFCEMNYHNLQLECGLVPKPARGVVCDVDEPIDNEIGAEFRVYMEDAWSAYPNIFRYILSKKFPALSMAYLEFEPGYRICNIHDPEERFFPERILCDGHIGTDDFYEFFEMKDQAKSFLEKKFQMEFPDIEKTEEVVEEKMGVEMEDVDLKVYFFKTV